MTNAAFDVFIEGPMGGIWFWNIMGVGIAAVYVYRRYPLVLHTSLKTRPNPSSSTVGAAYPINIPGPVAPPTPQPWIDPAMSTTAAGATSSRRSW